MKRYYDTEAARLNQAIDIAIAVFKKYPPQGFEQKYTNHMVEVYAGWKEGLLNAERKFRNLQSLKYDEQAVFTYFQEGTGITVDEFWRMVKEAGLGYKRSNLLAKILKRKKIKNTLELDTVTDTMVPLHQDGLLTDEEFEQLSLLVGEFEERHAKK